MALVGSSSATTSVACSAGSDGSPNPTSPAPSLVSAIGRDTAKRGAPWLCATMPVTPPQISSKNLQAAGQRAADTSGETNVQPQDPAVLPISVQLLGSDKGRQAPSSGIISLSVVRNCRTRLSSHLTSSERHLAIPGLESRSPRLDRTFVRLRNSLVIMTLMKPGPLTSKAVPSDRCAGKLLFRLTLPHRSTYPIKQCRTLMTNFSKPSKRLSSS